MIDQIVKILGEEANYLREHTCTTISKEKLHLPGPDFVERTFLVSDRPAAVLRNLQSILSHGRLGGTGYLSILPVDQGVEHSAGSAFASNPEYFDPENIVTLAIEGGCNAVASTRGVLGSVARKYAHAIPYFGMAFSARSRREAAPTLFVRGYKKICISGQSQQHPA